MKKKFLSSGVAIIALLALAACTVPVDSSSSGSSSSSSSSESSSSSSSSSSQTTADWTTAQKAVMTSHLEGYVLPYISLHADATVTWYSEWECVSIESKKAPTTKIAEYKSILTNAGFTFTYDDYYESWDGVLVLNSTYDLVVNIYSGEMDDGVYNFICDAFLDDGTEEEEEDEEDEYLTEWPTDQIEDYLGEGATIPEIDADNYHYETYYEDQGFHVVFVIGGFERVNEYITILELANWTVTEGEDFYTATNPEETIEIDFYNDDSELIIIIYGPEPEHQAWPQETIEDFLGDLLNSSNAIPVFETDLSFSFEVLEAETVDENILTDWLYIGLSDDSLNEANSEDIFKASLEDNGYTIDDSEYDVYGYFATSSDKAIYIQFFYWDGQFNIFIIGYNDYFLVEELAAWPTDLVADFVNNDEIVVPAASGESFIVSSLSGAISISVPVADGEAAVSAYESLLTSGGWTVVDHTAINAGAEDSQIIITISSEMVAGQANLVILIEGYVIPLPAGVFDFIDEAQMTVKGANSSTWKSGNVTMLVEKNGSEQDVGNGSFYSDPLRLYAKQKITFTATGQNISSIVFVTESASYASVLANASWTNATAVASGATVTVIATATTDTISFVLGAQTRLISAEVILA